MNSDDWVKGYREGERAGRKLAASSQSRSKALLGKIRTAWCHYNCLNAEYEYSLSEGGESDVTRDQVEHAWEDLNSLIMPNKEMNQQ